MTHSTVTDNFATLIEPSTLQVLRWLPGPVERVWDYLTDSELRKKWLAAGDMDLVPGAPVELVWRNDDLSVAADRRPEGFNEEQRMPSQVIYVDPPRELTIAWGEGQVNFRLEPKDQKVLLTLTHRGLDQGPARFMICAGWHMHLDILAAKIVGGEGASFWSGWAKLKTIYETRLPL